MARCITAFAAAHDLTTPLFLAIHEIMAGRRPPLEALRETVGRAAATEI